ncbi:MAG TPA: ABC transporter permease [Terracidiphilus sp.]|jgi:predicted permease
MNWIPSIFRRRKLYNDLAEEMRLHMEEHAEQLMGEGMSRREAEQEARRAFGNRTLIEERSRVVWQWPTLESIWADLRFALRQLRRSPGFTVAAVLTLALAIGANAVVFAVLNAFILRPLNVPQRESLYEVENADDIMGYESYPDYLDLRDRNRSFDALAAYNISQAGLDTGNDPSRVWLYEASGNYFDVLGIQPFLGRVFHGTDEHGPNSAPYIVLAYAYWHDHFQDDRGVVGRVVQVNKHPFTIIGVAPPGFHGTLMIFSPDFFVPIVNQEQVDGLNFLNARGNALVPALMGHLKAGVSASQATADLNSIRSYLEKTYPKDHGHKTLVLARPALGGDWIGRPLRAFLSGLMLLAGLILLAACANLGNLFAARAADRSREVALRLALGSSRMRILRQLLTEAVLISLAGGAAGLAGSVVLLHRLSAWQPFPEFPMNIPVNPDANVYLVALVLALVSGFLFGIIPVRQVFRVNPYEIVKAGSTGRVGRRITARDILLVVQIAICAVLVTSSMVAVRGLARSLHSNFGFEPRNAMLVFTDLGMAGYSGDKLPAMQRRMIDAMEAIPGVKSVGLVDSPPLHMGWDPQSVFADQTTDLKPSNAAAIAITFNISPEYFRAAGTALLAGRSFSWNDDKNSPRVAVVNREFAGKILGSETDAIGRHFKMSDGTRIEVVGIAEDGKYTANLTEDPQPAMFLPILQSLSSQTYLVVRSGRDPQQLVAAIRNKLRDLDPGLPAFVQTWYEEMNGALFASRMATVSLGVLGVMGVMLSITGIFGMAAYSVSKRLRELGIRIALGAQRKEVLQAALGRPLKLLAWGSAAGLLLGLLATRVLAYIVYQATPRDPLVLTGVVLAMMLLGLVATWIPAQRALSVNPLILLREE